MQFFFFTEQRIAIKLCIYICYGDSVCSFVFFTRSLCGDS